MKIYDISQEMLSCKVFPGDPAPEANRIMSMAEGDLCNLSTLFICAHNGTHVDAPFHFFNEGKTVDEIEPDVFCGDCYVARCEGNITAPDAEKIMRDSAKAGAKERILIAGRATVTEEAANVFVAHKIKLVGNESQTVGPENAPARVHEILLGSGIVLLEGIRLYSIPEGKYLLSAAPLKLSGFDGSPCRAVLIQND